jgi:uncharacterized membrane protein HdeD (DUF308 family)
MLHVEAREAVKQVTGTWWLFLLTGLAWFLISLVVLRMNIAAVATVGLLLGAVFLASAFEELLVATVRPGWAWARYLLAGFLVAGAIWSFVHPYDAFWSLAAALGLLLVLKGTLDIVESVASQAVSNLWWLGLVSGILEVGLGFWASQQFYPARGALLLLWVGFYGLFRGFSEIALAFQLRASAESA